MKQGLLLAVLALGACSLREPVQPATPPVLTPATMGTKDLLGLPPPKGKIAVAVYGFRDQTGQYKASPDSSFSTAVTQGAASMLVKALRDSGWFVPLEREGLQNLLTERRIIRAIESNQDRPNPAIQLPPLLPAQILIEGGIVAYETNVKTGGAGVRYLGVGASELYRMDQVTVNLRVVDMRTGQILNSVSTTKTVFSRAMDFGVFRFVSFRRLLEVETGYSRNEPAQLCVKEAIEAGVIHLIAQGVRDKQWFLREEHDLKSPLLQQYLRESEEQSVGPGPTPDWLTPPEK